MDSNVEGFDLITEKPRSRNYNCFISSRWINSLIGFWAITLSIIVIVNISLTIRLMQQPCVKQTDFKQSTGQMILEALKYTFSESENLAQGGSSAQGLTTSDQHANSGETQQGAADGDGVILAQITQDDLKMIRGSCKGPKGNKGTSVKGDTGTQGLKGVTGSKGDKGGQGQKGEAGHSGMDGLPGLDGGQGINGEKGNMGLTGVKGEKGDKGDTGPKGEIGAKGEKGRPAPPGFRYFCGFEDTTTCSFNQSSTDNMEWIITNTRTPSDDTGPTAAFEGSYYAHIEATSANTGAKAVLKSPSIPAAVGDACIQAYFHMHGDHMGTFSITLVFDDETVEPLYEVSGDQGDSWYVKRIDIPDKQKSYQVWFTAERGTDYQSDISMDGISLRSGYC